MLTDLNAGALIVGDAGVGGSEINANGTVVHFSCHDCVCGGGMWEDGGMGGVWVRCSSRAHTKSVSQICPGVAVAGVALDFSSH